jgi:AraC family transcriptional regulator of adaptative response / DNA-3-methyladenine glycosylase II
MHQIPESPTGVTADAAYRALVARDSRFDGRVWFAVTSTGIYCRPVCPAQTPKRTNVRFFSNPAAAVSAGFRACKRCRPDSQPGSRAWDHRGDLAGRALRLIADGAVDNGGVGGLAATLHVSERHLHRTLIAAVGAGPLQLATSRRAQTARMLIDQTSMRLSDVAFAAGFASIRQFNEISRREFGCPPSELRRQPATPLGADDPMLLLRLKFRQPYDASSIGAFLAARAVKGLESHVRSDNSWRHQRVIRLPHGPAVVTVEPREDHILLATHQVNLGDTAKLVSVVRRWLDLDADPDAVADMLGVDEALLPAIRERPGLRVPTTVEPWETCVRAIVGQQISVVAATTLLGRLVANYGETVSSEWWEFPRPDSLASAGPEALAKLGLTGARSRSLHALATAIVSGSVPLGDVPREDTLAALVKVPGIGPWTLAYVALRALGDPDAFPVTDLVLLRGAGVLNLPTVPRALLRRSAKWSPWRAYAASHLWASAPTPERTRRLTIKESL